MSEAETRKYHDHLEELGDARIAELVAANKRLQHEIAQHKRAEEALREATRFWQK